MFKTLVGKVQAAAATLVQTAKAPENARQIKSFAAGAAVATAIATAIELLS